MNDDSKEFCQCITVGGLHCIKEKGHFVHLHCGKKLRPSNEKYFKKYYKKGKKK